MLITVGSVNREARKVIDEFAENLREEPEDADEWMFEAFARLNGMLALVKTDEVAASVINRAKDEIAELYRFNNEGEDCRNETIDSRSAAPRR